MKNLRLRDKNILKLRNEQNWSYNTIGKKYGISGERVKQICFATEDNKKVVISEIREKYTKKLSTLGMKDVFEDIKELAKHDRRAETVAKRAILVKFLHDKLGIPFYKIGSLLNRDHTSIIHLYRNYDNG